MENLIEKQQAEIEELKKIQENKEKFYKKLSEDNELYVSEIKKKDLEIASLQKEHDYDVKMIDEVKDEAVKLYKIIDLMAKDIKEADKFLDSMGHLGEYAGYTIEDIIEEYKKEAEYKI